MAQYIVRARNREYEGKTSGVRFNHGEAFVNDYTIDKRLGKDLRAVIAELSELGYEVQEVIGEADRVAQEFILSDGSGKSAFPVPEKEAQDIARDRESTAYSVGSPTRVQEQVDPDSLKREKEYLSQLTSPVHTEAPAGARVEEQVDPDPVPYRDEVTGAVVVPAAEKVSGETINPKAESVTADGKITADETPNAAIPMEMQRRNATAAREDETRAEDPKKKSKSKKA